MRLLFRLATAPLLALILANLAVPNAPAVTLDWVTVGDPRNVADTTGFGAVDKEFRIMKYEWTNSQYVQFLNAVDPEGTNPNLIYNANMGTSVYGGITNTGTANGSRYALKENMGEKPVNYLSWWDAARVANWLHNGAQTYGSTDSTASAPQNTGAYMIGTGTSGDAPARSVDALFYIPTENQWYKAAYYKGGGTNAGYWDYATQSDTAPVAVGATAVGVGASGGVSPVITGNFANYDFGANWNGLSGYVTSVGTNGGASAYGTFDMSGNIWEWNDLAGAAGSLRGLRGGNFIDGAAQLSSSSIGVTPVASSDELRLGFRLASPVAVPEPSTYCMALAGLACGGYTMFRRRKWA